MFRNDRAITPLRLKQAIDSRFIELDSLSSLVLIDGNWVEFLKLPPAVNCAELRTMYKGRTNFIETPIINATGCTSLNQVFKGCSNLKTVKYIHTPDVSEMQETFHSCSSLTSVPKMDMSSVTNMSSMFNRCSSLTSVPELDISNEANMRSMFFMCSKLSSVTFTGDVVLPYGTNMFYSTPISSKKGYIFVPDELVDEYKNAEGWSTHASVIKGISEQGALQSNINMYNMQIEENPTMFALTEEEQEELEK